MFSYELIYRYGGVYTSIDSDEVVDSFIKEIEKSNKLFVMTSKNEFGASPHHPIIQKLIDN